MTAGNLIRQSVVAFLILGAGLGSLLVAQESPPIVQAYGDKLSYQPGEEVSFHVSSRAANYDVEIARVGLRREAVWSKKEVPGVEYPTPDNASSHGCNWPVAFTLKIPPEWTSGYYEVVFTATIEGKRVVGLPMFFVVRSANPGRDAPILMHLTTNTYNAYNNWGGYSLYAFNGKDKVQGRRVSFQRPIPGFVGNWELPFIQWAEKAGYRIDYAVNSDLEFHPEILKPYKLVISVGHDEYWSSPMREAMEAYIAQGGNLASFSGNTICWQVRFEEQGRTMTCWKQTEEQDPLFKTGPHRLLSSLWSHHLVKRPENELLGTGFMWGGYHRSHGQLMDGSGAYTVHHADHWAYEGTGVKNGQEFGGKDTIVGYETDGAELVWENGVPKPTGSDGTPKNFLVLGTAPAIWAPDDCEWYEKWPKGRKGTACMGIHTKEGGGTVFVASTTDWSHGLRGGDPVVDRVTRNVLNRLSGEAPGQRPTRDHGAALRSMKVRDGFVVELAAAEPLTMDPVDIAWGPDGKLWVVEMADYPLGMDGKGKPGGRVRFLEDTDSDGRYDKSTLFMDNIPFPTGVMPWRDGVLVTAAPEIFFAKDIDGDGKADKKEVLYAGFAEGNQQHRVNGLQWGLDNWVYVANGDSGGKIKSKKTGQSVDIRGRDLRIKPDEGLVEAETGQTQFGRNRDDWGDWFGCNNVVPAWHYVLPDRYLRRNPHYAPPRPMSVLSDSTLIYPISPVINHSELYIKPPEAGAENFTAACGLMVYRDDLFGPPFMGNGFVSDTSRNVVSRMLLRREGVTFRSSRAEDETNSEFLASTDPWFRPAAVRTGPDGALWVTDMYRAVIEHPQWIPDDIEARINVRAGDDLGRIYRIYPKGKTPRAIPRLDKLDTAGLVAALDSPSGWQRDVAQQLLLWRGDKSAIAPLEELVKTSKRPEARLHALCTLDGLESLGEGILLLALNDEHPGVRRHAVGLSETVLKSSQQVGDVVLQLAANETDSQVRLQLAFSLGEWTDPRAGDALGQLAVRTMDQPYIQAAVMTSSVPHAERILVSVLEAGNEQPSKLAPQLVGVLVATDSPDAIVGIIRKMYLPPRESSGRRGFEQMALLLASLESHRDVGRKVWDQVKDDPASSKSLERFWASAHAEALSENAALSDRVAAVELLGLKPDRSESDVKLLAGLLTPQTPVSVQVAAVVSLGKSNDEKTLPGLMDGWASYGPDVREKVLDTLLTRPKWAGALLERVERDPSLVSAIDLARRQVLLAHPNNSVKQKAKKLFVPSTRQDVQNALEQFKPATTLAGDVERGRGLFASLCATCHLLDGVGRQVGANLAALGDRSPQTLLVSILDPNSVVEARYAQYVASLKDGRSLVGILAEETSGSVKIIGLDAQEMTVLRKDLVSLSSTGVSMMPEGLGATLDAQKMADLLAYLARGGAQPKTFANHSPQVVKPSDDGSLTLPASAAEIYGPDIVFEQQFRNIGYWTHPQAYVVWKIRLDRAASFDVSFDYACPPDNAGGKFVLAVADQRISGTVSATKSWEDYQPLTVGRIALPAGEHRLTVRVEELSKFALMDLRAIRLKPVK